MRFIWTDYHREDEETVEKWMDPAARKNTGCEDGWADYADACIKETDTVLGENFWLMKVSEEGTPFAAIAVGLWEGELTVSELVVAPERRGRGFGAALLAELLENSGEILGKDFVSAKAVIFPDNAASQKAFERAGFHFESAHPDGDAWYYAYRK
ncbi:MAG: GNAT family N-acetyltransferase [Ruminococcaceae bacterium]|nr:GNAT family N-acetyltransferase [Oscillospiraceae bacterium]